MKVLSMLGYSLIIGVFSLYIGPVATAQDNAIKADEIDVDDDRPDVAEDIQRDKRRDIRRDKIIDAIKRRLAARRDRVSDRSDDTDEAVDHTKRDRIRHNMKKAKDRYTMEDLKKFIRKHRGSDRLRDYIGKLSDGNHDKKDLTRFLHKLSDRKRDHLKRRVHHDKYNDIGKHNKKAHMIRRFGEHKKMGDHKRLRHAANAKRQGHHRRDK